tara:strand:+ start:279 stop:482 length:204 start_codon:yes stop_codon:yes gene_type:complete
MGAKGEEIRQAKKFLENKKISIKKVKPHLFAIAANGLKKDFDNTLKFFLKGNNGTADSSNKEKNKRS